MKLHIKITALALIAALALTGCSSGGEAAETPVESEAPSPSPYEVIERIETDGRFTLKYSAQNSMNPITGSNFDNMTAARLIYEGLFVLDPGFTPEPVLCESFTTEDGVTYDFTLKSGVKFSDGSPLTAADAAYSINAAAGSDRYSGRLELINGVETVDELVLRITLDEADYRLPALLDIPIIKQGSIDSDSPVGTGPYKLVKSGGTVSLAASSTYRDAGLAPVDTIYLREFETDAITEEFANGGLDMLTDDPCDGQEYLLRGDYDTRTYGTTLFQYVGLNMENAALADVNIRKAIAYCVDRAYICDTIMGGSAVQSPLIYSPRWSGYNTEWEPDAKIDRAAVADIFRKIGMKDFDKDGYLEYPMDAYGSWLDMELKFVVYEGSPLKLAAAKRICDALSLIGVRAEITQFSWNDYVYTLGQGDFDLYFAEVMLPANFDFSELLTENGSLNYGGIADETYDRLITSTKQANTEAARETAFGALARYAAETLPIIPVLYREYSVYSPRNVIQGLTPTQSSVFFGLEGWKLDIPEA